MIDHLTKGLTHTSCAVRRLGPATAVLALCALALTGCNPGAPAVAPEQAVRPALIQEVGASDMAAKLRFPGRLRASKRAELSFNVPVLSLNSP